MAVNYSGFQFGDVSNDHVHPALLENTTDAQKLTYDVEMTTEYDNLASETQGTAFANAPPIPAWSLNSQAVAYEPMVQFGSDPPRRMTDLLKSEQTTNSAEYAPISSEGIVMDPAQYRGSAIPQMHQPYFYSTNPYITPPVTGGFHGYFQGQTYAGPFSPSVVKSNPRQTDNPFDGSLGLSATNVSALPTDTQPSDQAGVWYPKSYQQGDRIRSHRPAPPTTPTGSNRGRSRASSPSSVSRLTCETCGSVFNKKHELDHHRRSHGDKAQVCTVCNKGFVFRKDLVRHIVMHSKGERHMFCNVVGCKYHQRGFGRVDHLRRHMEKKHPGIPRATQHTVSLGQDYQSQHYNSQTESRGLPPPGKPPVPILAIPEADSLRPTSINPPLQSEVCGSVTLPSKIDAPVEEAERKSDQTVIPELTLLPSKEAHPSKIAHNSEEAAISSASVCSNRGEGDHFVTEISHDDHEDEVSSIDSGSTRASGGSSDKASVFSMSIAPSKTTTQPTTMDSRPPLYPCPTSEHLEDYETDSIRTDGRDDGLEPQFRAHFAFLFAAEILDNLLAPDKASWSVSVVTALLLQYSLLLDAQAERNFEKYAASFIRHRRNMIARSLLNPHTPSPSKSNLPTLKEKMELLMNKVGSEHEPTDIDLSGISAEDEEISDDEDDPVSVYPDFQRAKAFLCERPEFSWLIYRLRVASSTTISGQDVFNNVRNDLLKAVLGRDSLELVVDWNPEVFLKEQYNLEDLPSFSNVICIVGSGTTTEAMTCLEYVSRIWPTCGPETLRVLDVMVKMQATKAQLHLEGSFGVAPEPDYIELCRPTQTSYKLHDTLTIESDMYTQLEVRLDENRTTFMANSALSMHLIELGEVLCWLTATCRSLAVQNQMAYCMLLVTVDTLQSTLMRCYGIDVAMTAPMELKEDVESANCWRRIFNNAPITYGYPIMRRNSEDKGLQISLQMMVVLASTHRASMFRGYLLLKGLCSMFVPIIKTTSSIVWHYLLNDDLSWMSSNGAWDDGREVAKIDVSSLSSLKHFVGWTSICRSSIGTSNACYDKIDYSQSPHVKAGFAFDGVTLGFSKIIELSTKITPGKKDTRIPGFRVGCYARTINIAALMNVVFYDVKAKRGWLVDGASALLLLGRACLTSPRAPGLDCTGPTLPSDQFVYSNCRTSGSQAAKEVLLNPVNRRIALYENETTPWLFEDLILQLFDVISDIKSLVPKLSCNNNSGWNIRTKRSARLEGFEFVDIISGKINPRARFARLETSGANWMPLLAVSETVNILGSSFGALLRPPYSGCKNFVDLPCGASLLAVPIDRLRAIACEFGEVTNEYWKLTDGRYWIDPYESFPSSLCGCSLSGPSNVCGKLITELQSEPKSNARGKRRKLDDLLEVYPSGAIIIGSSSAVNKMYHDSQSEGDFSPAGRIRSNGSDSGIDLGSSLSPSSSRSPGRSQ